MFFVFLCVAGLVVVVLIGHDWLPELKCESVLKSVLHGCELSGHVAPRLRMGRCSLTPFELPGLRPRDFDKDWFLQNSVT